MLIYFGFACGLRVEHAHIHTFTHTHTTAGSRGCSPDAALRYENFSPSLSLVVNYFFGFKHEFRLLIMKRHIICTIKTK